MSIQMMLLGVGAVATKTYVDDIFSTFLYEGTGSSHTINNGIDLSASGGGMVWIKDRDNAVSHNLYDTERGATKFLVSDGNDAEDNSATRLNLFNNNGFRLGGNSTVNGSGNDYTSWSFRKAPGFFDVVTYTGNGSNRTISHSLGCKPGFMIIKKIDGSDDWQVWHRDLLDNTKFLILNENYSQSGDAALWNSTAPTSTEFSLGSGKTNDNTKEYVAYLFAGGESDEATARSVDFDGSSDFLNIQTSGTDLEMGSSDFTVEAWVKPTATNTNLNCILSCYVPLQLYWKEDSFKFYAADSSGNYFVNHLDAGANYPRGQWYHVAVTRSGSTFRLFVNGLLVDTATSSTALGGLDGYYPSIGKYNSSSNGFAGSISNVRIVKGTAVYTSSFKPSTEPLTNITNTKLLCCNNSSTTGSTVTPATVYAGGSPTASTDSPFDDPAAFTFGESGSESVVKCGSYVGNGSATGPEINLGWEPQWVLTKNADISDVWYIYDNMRGIVSDGYDPRLSPNSNSSESSGDDRIDITPTGFKIKNDNGDMNGNGNTIIYMCIRRPDGYVGKPPELGTGVFAMDTGNSSATIPAFDSGFVVDMRIAKKPASSSDWWLIDRLRGQKHLFPQKTDDEGDTSWGILDSNVGEGENWDSSYQAWMWKRHAGFDLVATSGGQGKLVPHSLGKIPEMIWLKGRDFVQDWNVYHKGANSGTNPEQYGFNLNDTYAESQQQAYWNNVAPTATHFSTGTSDSSGGSSSYDYIVMLFASVDGISKVGYYTGTASSNTITTGFQPRFVFIKRSDGNGSWMVHDSVRGFTSGDDPYLRFNTDAGQSNFGVGTLISTGFIVSTTDGSYNADGGKYIYYAHA